MKILIRIPVPIDSNRGNRITGSRWTEFLNLAGHEVQLSSDMPAAESSRFDCVIVLNAYRSADFVLDLNQIRSAEQSTSPRIVVCMTGTDLHRDYVPGFKETNDGSLIESSQKVISVWQACDRIVLLEPKSQDRIPARFHQRCRVIFQSAEPVKQATNQTPSTSDHFRVSVIGHLRPIKDPFRAAAAAKLLSPESRIQIIHVGAALTPEMQEQATSQMDSNPRYVWLGPVSHDRALQYLLDSQVMVLSSISEGAPSVISEAVVNDVPVIASRIDASIGMLGADYPGLFETGDTQGLAELMSRAESAPSFLKSLLKSAEPLKKRLAPSEEKAALQALLAF